MGPLPPAFLGNTVVTGLGKASFNHAKHRKFSISQLYTTRHGGPIAFFQRNLFLSDDLMTQMSDDQLHVLLPSQRLQNYG